MNVRLIPWHRGDQVVNISIICRGAVATMKLRFRGNTPHPREIAIQSPFRFLLPVTGSSD